MKSYYWSLPAVSLKHFDGRQSFIIFHAPDFLRVCCNVAALCVIAKYPERVFWDERLRRNRWVRFHTKFVISNVRNRRVQHRSQRTARFPGVTGLRRSFRSSALQLTVVVTAFHSLLIVVRAQMVYSPDWYAILLPANVHLLRSSLNALFLQ